MQIRAIAKLRDTRTGQVIDYHDLSVYPSVDAAVAFWAEGECSCDCNRSLAILKARHPGVAITTTQVLPCRRTKHVIELVSIEVLVVIEDTSEIATVITA